MGREKAVHYDPDGEGCGAVCNLPTITELTTDPDQVTCARCQDRIAFLARIEQVGYTQAIRERRTPKRRSP